MNTVPKNTLRLFAIAAVFCSIAFLPNCETHGQGTPIPFSEKFALAENREAVLQQLVPGSDEYYFYSCLHYQQKGDLKKVDQLTKKWDQMLRAKHRSRGKQAVEIYLRQLLLKYPNNPPEKILREIKGYLSVSFNHRPEEIKGEAKYPSKLDKKWTDPKYWLRHYNSDNYVQYLSDYGLMLMARKKYSHNARFNLLRHLKLPDYPDLVRLIADEMKHRENSYFGMTPIHYKLTLKQLNELKERYPRVLTQQNFVNTYLQKLLPNDDTSIWRNPKQKRQYINQCRKFVKDLPDTFLSLKANLLYQLLLLDKKEGKFDKERFFAYLAIPRHTTYINQKWMKQYRKTSNVYADLNYQNPVQELSRIRNDEKLIRFYLEHYLKDADHTKEFEKWVEGYYLKRVLGELKLVQGIGDADKWSQIFSPEELKKLNERVDLEFAPTTPDRWDIGQRVKLKVKTKAINKLIVKVFHINAENFYRQFGQNITTNINLDGLVPSFQKSYDYNSPAIRIVEREFEFPQCDKPGVYVIDFIGNGKSSRALIKKGKLELFTTETPAGHRLVVLDQTGKIVKKSKVWIDGRWVTADKDGDIVIPYTSKPETKKIIFSDGVISNLGWFQHQSSNYQFDAGIFVSRESLLPNRKAKIVLRPSLHVNGKSLSLNSVTEAKVTLTALNHDGIPAQKTIKVDLKDQTEVSVPFQLTERISQLNAVVSIKFDDPISGNSVSRTARQSFLINQIEKTFYYDQAFLVPTQNGYFLEVRGKTGEIREGRVVSVNLSHNLVKSTRTTTLQTDKNGRIELGHLPGIKKLTVTVSGNPAQSFDLNRSVDTYQNLRHVTSDQPIEIPNSDLVVIQLGKKDKNADPGLLKLGRWEFTLFEYRNGRIYKDYFHHLRQLPGRLIVKGLPPGNYKLHAKKTGRIIDIKVSDGKIAKHMIVGKHRILGRSSAQTATISKIQADDEFVTVQLENWSADTRLHILGNRFYPAFSSVDLLSVNPQTNPSLLQTGYQGSSYVTGRKIGDEYDYILRRNLAIKFPGLMLPKPSLLLNPFKVRQTNNQNLIAAKGGEFSKKSDSRLGQKFKPKAAPKKKSIGSALNDFSSLEFLGQQTIELTGLKPNKNGIIKIPVKQFASKQFLKFVMIDNDQVQSAELNFAALNLQPMDLRFDKSLDSSTHFSENKTVQKLSPKVIREFHRSENPNVRIFNELNDVFQFYLTKSNNPSLRKFRFITNWTSLKDDQKKRFYSEFACHELNFFIYQKDRPFFENVIKPYVKNKYEKTFVDLYLLGEDLTSFLDAEQLRKLNYMEQFLLIRRMKEQRDSLATSVKQRLDVLTENLPKPDRQFDTVLNSAFDSSIQFQDVSKKLERLHFESLSHANESIKVDSRLYKKNALYAQPSESSGKGGGFGGGAFAGRITNGLANRPAGGKNFKYAGEDRSAKDLGIMELGDADKEKISGYRSSRSRGRRESAEFFRLDEKKFAEKRKQVQRYQPISPTFEWAENNYYHVQPERTTSHLITANRFWLDYCNEIKNPADRPFLSGNFLEVGNGFTEIMFALAVLDLPLKSEKEKIKTTKDVISIEVHDPALAVLKRLEKTKSNDPDTKILVSENFIRKDDPYVTKNGVRYDKFVTDKFYTHTIYQGQVAVTNPTSSPRKFQLLVQLPEGSMPVYSGVGTKTVNIQLNPYSTTTFKTYFYFPGSGKFKHYPAQVSNNQIHLANGKARTFHVEKEVTKLDPNSWTYIARYGTDKQVFEFLDKNNLWRIPLGKVAYRLRNKEFYNSMVKLLDARHFHDTTTNSYSIIHNDRETLKKFLKNDRGFRSRFGPCFYSDWFVFDTQQENGYQHREYWPLVNSRFHQLGKVRRIANPSLSGQYNKLLERLIRKNTLTQDDRLAICYFLLVQDRFQEAVDNFRKVKRNAVAAKIQYDFFAASMALIESDTKTASAIANKYLNHSVSRWQKRFQAVSDQIKQIQDPNAVVKSESSYGKDNLFKEHTDQSNIANDAPSFDYDVRSNAIELQYRNLKQVKVNFYEIDLELLFSRNPFQKTGSQSFDWVKPNHTMTVKVDPKKRNSKIDIPKHLRNRNVLVEVAAGGTSKTLPYYSRSFDAQFAERFGQLRVTDKKSSKPISKVYVKVYAKMRNGKVQFFKDGYTDLRGRFDYVTQNNVPLQNVQKLSVLVLSKDKGAFTKELNPPAH